MREKARWEGLVTAQRFKRVCESGKKYRDSCLSLYLLSSPDGTCRAGISVGKRIGNAVRRNRAKRLIREALRLNRYRVARRVWIVFVAQKEIVKADYSEVEADLVKLLEQAGAFY